MGGILRCFGTSCEGKACEISSVIFDCTTGLVSNQRDVLFAKTTNRFREFEQKALETPFFGKIKNEGPRKCHKRR